VRWNTHPIFELQYILCFDSYELILDWVKISSDKYIAAKTTTNQLIIDTYFVATSVCSTLLENLSDDDEIAGIVEYMKRNRSNTQIKVNVCCTCIKYICLGTKGLFIQNATANAAWRRSRAKEWSK